MPPPLPQTVQLSGTLDVDEGILQRLCRHDRRRGRLQRRDGLSRAPFKNAQYALTVIIGILIVLLYGTAWLTKHYQIMAMDPDGVGYQSLLSLLVTAVFGADGSTS